MMSNDALLSPDILELQLTKLPASADEHAGPLFQQMSPDSKLLQNTALGRQKHRTV